jgi:hypothetical protein
LGFVFGILLKATDNIETYMQGRVSLRSEKDSLPKQ